jgi:predicted transcriptional regulator
MRERKSVNLSRRERQIMDVIYARRKASVAQVLARLEDPPSYSAVRALLRILENKGHLQHRQVGGKYVYWATHPRRHAARWALRRILETFFDNSASQAVAALLSNSDMNLSDQELTQLSELLQQARNRNRRKNS